MVEIIENTDEAKAEFHGRFYGGGHIKLDKEQLQALLDGKCLAFDVNAEYTITLEIEEDAE